METLNRRRVCGVISGSALFAYVPQKKDARLIWVKDGSTEISNFIQSDLCLVVGFLWCNFLCQNNEVKSPFMMEYIFPSIFWLKGLNRAWKGVGFQDPIGTPTHFDIECSLGAFTYLLDDYFIIEYHLLPSF